MDIEARVGRAPFIKLDSTLTSGKGSRARIYTFLDYRVIIGVRSTSAEEQNESDCKSVVLLSKNEGLMFHHEPGDILDMMAAAAAAHDELQMI